MIPLSLPLVPTTPADPRWEGFRAAGWDAATLAPQPEGPQGEYAPPGGGDGGPLQWPVSRRAGSVELLAPAGGPDAAFAAFQHGADAVYLGLKKFSARAEAENFTLDEVGEVTAYAHSLTPPRRVFVTVNTVVRQDELGELVDDLSALEQIGVDAVIVQDLGVASIARRHFPELELHASTQLAAHNLAGARVLGQWGFRRVVLARELTLEEVHDVTAASGIETEVFVHGALCYSYSGLCLFSSQTSGRSGNRGRCAYSCRDSFTSADAPATLRDGTATRRDPHAGFPFSMKDLALPDHLPMLHAAGVSCFKIEGRKKSPLYVATTTEYYRGLIDGTISDNERAEREAELQTVFSRPWTRLFVQSHKDKEVADRDTVGHRGTPVGRVESLDNGRVCFVTSRALERHDGLQVDLPVLGKPFGFPVDLMWVVGPGGRRRPVVAAPAGSRVEVALPPGHPAIPVDATVYCSSSQSVKQKYRYDRPKPGLYRPRQPIDVTVRITASHLTAEATAGRATASAEIDGDFPEARDPTALESFARAAFEKLGESGFMLGGLQLENPTLRFAPASRLNELRRQLIAQLTPRFHEAQRQHVAAIRSEVLPEPTRKPTPSGAFRWSIKTDRIDSVSAFTDEDWDDVEELAIEIDRDALPHLTEQLAALGERLGRDRIRLALPAITRKWEEKPLVAKIERLRSAGWSRWEAANVSAWGFLGLDPTKPTGGIDLATDWSVYVLNRAAARSLLDAGVTRFTLSPEDGRANLRSLLAEFAERAVMIVHQDTPQFIAESCAYANLIGGCPGKANCRFESMTMESSHGEKVVALDDHCRTIVLNAGPYCLSPRLGELAKLGVRRLRADFIYRRYTAEECRDRWRRVRAGRAVPGGHAANFDRGVQ
jgi:putative protease